MGLGMRLNKVAWLTLAIFSIPSEARIAGAAKAFRQIDAGGVTVTIINTQITLIHSCIGKQEL